MNTNFYHPELLQTPEGVRDIYGTECEEKTYIQNTIHDVIKSYGFQDIQTPAFEFFDIFNKERGTVASSDMYKFFDRNNNTLVLRPDITPSIARSVAKYYEDECMQVRLGYVGNTYINNASYQGKLMETTQVGAELINDATSDADAEMIAMTIESLLKSGLQEFQIDIGHAEFFNGLAEEANLNPFQLLEIKELLANKNVFAVEQYLSDLDLSEDIKAILIRLPEMFGNMDHIEYAKKHVHNTRSIAAIDRLEKLYEIIESYGFKQYVTFDLGMISTYNYYTGIIFRAYTYGTGEPVATGGRYDHLLAQFGKEGTAIGVAVNIDQLMLALQRQKISIAQSDGCTVILYQPEERRTAIELASDLRGNGSIVQMMRKSSRTSLAEYLNYATNYSVQQVIYIEEGNKVSYHTIRKTIKGEDKEA